jgi:hypothetical protein
MTRFLTILAVAAVAGAMYVAAAPGGLRSTGPTAKQFKLLTRTVTKLQKQVTTLKKEADATFAVLALCVIHEPVGVDQVGASTGGYLFGPPQTTGTAVTATAITALDLAPSTEASPQHRVFELNTSQPACVSFAGSASTLASVRSVTALAPGG